MSVTMDQGAEHLGQAQVYERELSHEAITFRPAALPPEKADFYEHIDQTIKPSVLEIDAGERTRITVFRSEQGAEWPYFATVSTPVGETEDGKKVYRPYKSFSLQPGTPTPIGREAFRDTFAANDTAMSRKHGAITVGWGGEITYADDSTYKSQIRYAEEPVIDEADIPTVPRASMLDEADIQTIPRDKLWSSMIAEKSAAQHKPGDEVKPDPNNYWKPPEPVSPYKVPEAKEAAPSAEVAEEAGEVAVEENVDVAAEVQAELEAEDPEVGQREIEEMIRGERPTPGDIKRQQEEEAVREAERRILEPRTEKPAEKPEPEEQEPNIPELADVFASPDSFQKALSNPDIDQEFRNTLRTVYTAWQEVKLAGVTDEVWEELSPKVKQVAQEVPGFTRITHETYEQAEQLAQGLREFANAVHTGDQEHMMHVVRKYQFGPLREGLSAKLHEISQNDMISKPAKILNVEQWDADDRIRKVRSGITSGAIDESSMEEMLGDLREYAQQGAGLKQMRDEIGQKINKAGGISWRQKRDAIEELSHFGRFTEEDLSRQLLTLNSVMDDLEYSIRNHRYNGDDIEYAARTAASLQEPLEQLERMGRRTQMAAEQAK